MEKRKILLISLSLALLISSFLIIKYYPSLKKTKEKETIPAALQRLTRLEVAKKVLWCLDKQVNEKGLYAVGSECIKGQGCKQFIAGNYNGIYVLWARFKYLQKVNDPIQLSLFIKDLEVYSSSEKVPIIMANIWTCRLLTEMAQSDIFSPLQKEKLVSICERAVIGGETMTLTTQKIDEKVKKGEYFDPNWEKILADLKNNKQLSKTSLSKEEIGNFSKLSVFVSDLAKRYLLKKDEVSLQKAKGYFGLSVDLYLRGGKTLSLGTKSVFGLAASDLYEATKENVFLDFAKNIWLNLEDSQPRLSEACWLGINPNPSCKLDLSEPVKAAFFADELFKQTKNGNYQITKDKILKNLISICFDLEGYVSFFNDGCFFSTNFGNFPRMVEDNGILEGLLIESSE